MILTLISAPSDVPYRTLRKLSLDELSKAKLEEQVNSMLYDLMNGKVVSLDKQKLTKASFITSF